MANKIQVKRGAAASIPALDVGEPGFTTDTKHLYVGASGGNVQLANMTDIPTVPSAGTSAPAMDGTASAGSASTWSKSDHVHPTDTTRAPINSPEFTGNPRTDTQPVGNNSRRLATTEFVHGEMNRSNNVNAEDTNYSTYMARAIAAGTSDMTAGTTALTSGCLYVMYEETT